MHTVFTVDLEVCLAREEDEAEALGNEKRSLDDTGRGVEVGVAGELLFWIAALSTKLFNEAMKSRRYMLQSLIERMSWAMVRKRR